MTKKRLSIAVGRGSKAFAALFGLGALLWGVKKLLDVDLYTPFHDLLSVLVAIPTAYLAFSFQQRNSYLQALRDLWKVLIPAVQRAVQYTRIENPDPKDYGATMMELSTAADLLRGVFRHVPDGTRVGLYPYEPLKDIVKVIDWLNEGRGPHERYLARRCILQLWYDVHSAMLDEFDREIPSHPVSKHLDNVPSIADKLMEGTLNEAVDLRP
jgi:hypothetical protein